MRLDPTPFAATKAGRKLLEVRLCDEKRLTLKGGDRIEFKNNSTGEILKVQVKSVRKYPSIEDLAKTEQFVMTGGIYSDPSDWIKSIYTYYPKDEQAKHGLLAIEVVLSVKLGGSVSDALEELAKYPNLNSLFDRAVFIDRANQKYPDGPEMFEDDFSDLFTALILSKNPMFQQDSSNAATPGGALSNLDRAINTLGLDIASRNALATRLMNLRTSSMWDSLTEVLLAETIAKNISSKRVRLDFQLGKSLKKGHQPKDADVALLDDDGNPQFLIDAITPKIHGPSSSVIDIIAELAEKKYLAKFDEYCKTTGARNVVIALSVLKSETVYLAFLPQIMSGKTIVSFTHPKLEALDGLLSVIVCSFRSPDGSGLVLDQIAKYERLPNP